MSRNGNKHQFDQINKEKREKTSKLLVQSIKNLISIGALLEIEDVSNETKRIDSKGKGISIAALYKKDLTHIQDILMEYGVGKYGRLSINKPSDQIDIHDIIKIQQENKKLQQENKKFKSDKKSLRKELEEKKIDIKKLNGKLIEIELKYKLQVHKFPVNRPIKNKK